MNHEPRPWRITTHNAVLRLRLRTAGPFPAAVGLLMLLCKKRYTAGAVCSSLLCGFQRYERFRLCLRLLLFRQKEGTPAAVSGPIPQFHVSWQPKNYRLSQNFLRTTVNHESGPGSPIPYFAKRHRSFPMPSSRSAFASYRFC